jgi:radical SAM superfamily enzyme YgiQ (UPF0313 family)
MKILFINPINLKPDFDKLPFLQKFVWGGIMSLPHSIRMLTSVTPKYHSISFIDERYQQINYNQNCDIVGISSMTPFAIRAYEIADMFRSRGIPVVLGGWHASALPEEAKQHADCVVIGDAEESWPQILQDIEKNNLKQFYEIPINFDKIPIPNRNKIHQSRVKFVEEVQASRGCNMQCKYCSVPHSKYRNKLKLRPINEVIDEIVSLQTKYFYFLDSSLTLNLKYSKQLFKAMSGSNKKFSCNGNISVLNRDDELLKLASEAGCLEWAIGFESIDQKSLLLVGKSSNKVNEYKKTVNKIHDYGMVVKGNFMFGMDNDYPDIFDNTISTIYDLNLDLVGSRILTPFPGTPLFDQLVNEKRLLTKNWSKYDCYNVVFKPRHMNPHELLEGFNKVWKTINSPVNNIRRSMKCLKFGIYTFLTSGIPNFFL